MPPALPFQAACDTILAHLQAMHDFYGEVGGVRIARKHIGWYLANLPDGENCRKQINQIDHAAQQFDALATFLQQQSTQFEFWQRDYFQDDFQAAWKRLKYAFKSHLL